MDYRVFLTLKAEADVAGVLQWFHEQRANDAGGRWLTQLMAKVNTLEIRPERCALAAESADLGQDIRELLFGRGRYRYRILFQIREKSVSILRILHSSRNVDL